MRKNKLGFTLVEIAIVLLILGLLVGGTLGPLSMKLEQKQRQETQEKLERIKDALYGFAITNGRLPCPDNDADGVEDLTGLTPACTIGTLPYTSLGINTITDAWDNSFIYRVTQAFADGIDGGACSGTVPPATVGISFQLCSEGDIKVEDLVGATVVDKVPVLVFSGGKNNYATGATTPEGENTDSDDTFVYSDISMVAGSEYDDLMVWISPNILKYRMVQAGRLP